MSGSSLECDITAEVESLARLISGFRITGILCAAAQLGLPDLVGPEGASPSRLAQLVGCEPDSIFRLLRALASIGVFEETPEGEFLHTSSSRLLKKDSEPSLHGLACFTGMVDIFAWPHILYSLRTGKPAFEKVFGSGIFEYMKEHPEVSQTFDQAMAGFTEVVARAVLDAYDFSPYRNIIDIGGGNGSLLKKISARYPLSACTIYDLDHVVARALKAVEGTGWEGRLRGIAGNFLEFVPNGGDLYIIKIVLCDWRDDDVRRILRNVRRAISHGRLLIIDAVLPKGNTPSFAKLSDINMLVTTGSRERTEENFRELLKSTGFVLKSVRPVHEWVGLLEAAPRD